MLANVVKRNLSQFHQITNGKMTKTAAIVIIGDEILKGHTQDTNSNYLCRILHSSGIKVKRISVIGDEIEDISSEIRNFSEAYDFVLTSGGIGPTHDDKTLEGVAQAFHETTIPHPKLVDLCTRYFGNKPMDSPELKMAHVPQSAILHFGVDAQSGRKLNFPLIAVKNVFVFPGIPSLLERTADNLRHLFQGDDKFHVRELLLDDLETNIATTLTECENKFSSAGVSVGSYPDLFNNYYKTRVIVESPDMEATQTAVDFISNSVADRALINDYVKDPISCKGKDVYDLAARQSSPLHTKVSSAIQIIEETLDRYSDNEICIGFNGGKDCTALLHLFYAVICRKLPGSQQSIQSLYVKDPHPFEEVERFMEESHLRYNLRLISFEGKIKPALENLKMKEPSIKCVLMGTRFTDPYSRNLTHFCPTDKEWPEYMRINPMLNWSYHDVWDFLRTLWLPYCVLYDRGYSSLGSRENTKRNEKLIYFTENSTFPRYHPAYALQDEDFERNGRL